MNFHLKKYLMAGITLAILGLFFQAIRLKGSPVVSATSSEVALQEGATDLYLPVVMRNYPAPPSIFGVEINIGRATETMTQMAYEANVSWVRHNDLLWHEIEETQGTRNWGARFEDAMIELNRQGLTPMVIVRGTPTWAQKVPGAICGPIKEDALDDFADFMREAVTRYSVPPYNVKYWELGNEPDVDPSLIPGTQPFGCWGDSNDEFYGGGYYAEMLKRAYPVIKEVDPNAKVLIGGLLLDCDPTGGTSCPSGPFLEGILQNGGADYFDIVVYHAYTFWSDAKVDWDLEHAKWNHRGGVLLGKLDFIREALSRHNVEKPIIMNEGGLLCYRYPDPEYVCEPDGFHNDQANYVIRLYARAGAAGLEGAIWYTLDGPGWQNGGLLQANQEPRPAYTALKFFGSQLKHATYINNLSTETMEGYQYSKDNTIYEIYWTNNDSTTSISLPANATVYNKFGQDITPSGSSVTISFEPVIIVRTN